MTNKIAAIETDKGTIKFELFEDKAPITTKNFIELAESGFYITLADAPFLDGNYAVFGKVVEGMHVVESIALGDKMNKVSIS